VLNRYGPKGRQRVAEPRPVAISPENRASEISLVGSVYMTALQIVFLITAVVTLGSALMVVTSRHLIHAALWLILALFGVAVLYVVLNAGFLAVAQVVIYIGAIAILIIFAVMMTRTLVEDFTKQLNAQWWMAALLSSWAFCRPVMDAGILGRFFFPVAPHGGRSRSSAPVRSSAGISKCLCHSI
jgi:NADH:ubiquinone oxidoreductase subunit 6 (subunit J)